MTRDKAIASRRRRACRSTSTRSRRTPSTRTSGAAPSRPASSRTPGTARSRTSTPTPSDPTVDREPDELVLTFVDGVPTAIDGQPSRCCRRSRSSTPRAGAQGVGRLDMVEDRLVGIKSREVYEVPGAQVLITAHQELESADRRARPRPLQARRRAALGRAGLRRPVVLAAQARPRRLPRDASQQHVTRRDPADAARRHRDRHRPAQRRVASTTSTSRRTTRGTPSTSPSPRASSSCGACRARSPRSATCGWAR